MANTSNPVLLKPAGVLASTDEPYHARHRSDGYGCTERENGAALEPLPAFSQSKDSRYKIQKQRDEKHRAHELVEIGHRIREHWCLTRTSLEIEVIARSVSGTVQVEYPEHRLLHKLRHLEDKILYPPANRGKP